MLSLLNLIYINNEIIFLMFKYLEKFWNFEFL